MIIEEIDNADELDAFFDEVNEVTSQQCSKLTKLYFILSKYDAYPSTPAPSHQEPSSSTLYSYSKLPDLNLPVFNGNITEWFGFWERSQSLVGNASDLPNAAEFAYLIGQLKGGTLTAIKGLTLSDQNYDIPVTTSKEHWYSEKIRNTRTRNEDPKATSIASILRHFYSTLMGDICSLNPLNIDVSACAPIIIPIIEERLPGKILSSIGDCGTDADFRHDEFTESFKNYILCQEQAHSSNALWVQDAQLTFSYDMH